jgi:hypothetical protein
MQMNWTDLTSQQQWKTLWNMREYGGGFASNLAEAWLIADSGNSARLAQAFPDMIDKYNPLTSNYRVTETHP